MAAGNGEIEKRLWAAADQLRANSNLKPSEYSDPVLGLLFLRYAERRFAEAEKRIGKVGSVRSGGRREITAEDYIREGVIYLPDGARFASLLKLPESANLGQALNDAMRLVEESNRQALGGVLPRTYAGIEKRTLRRAAPPARPARHRGRCLRARSTSTSWAASPCRRRRRAASSTRRPRSSS